MLLGFIKGAAQFNGVTVDPATRRKLDMMKLSGALPPPDRADGLQELTALTAKLSRRSMRRAPLRIKDGS